MMETWKDIPGYEGRYQVSDLGNVRGAKGLLSPNLMSNGYLCVHLYKSGKHTRKPITIHKLVATVFLGEGGGREINHKSFDTRDNRVINLEWCSHKDNVRHTILAGRKADIRNAVIAVSVNDGSVYKFNGQKDAELALRGKQTGLISKALRSGKPAYGFMWSLA